MENGPAAYETSMRLRFGLNQKADWHALALGPHREQIWARWRELSTDIVRIFTFDKGMPDPLDSWEPFAALVQAVLNTGAVPMITFSRFGPSYDDLREVRGFAGRCGAVVERCLEQWGGEKVRDWYWCVGDQPNSEWLHAGMTFEQYRSFYEEAARRMLRPLARCLEGRGPMIGGPAVDGFQPFWLDWIWRFVNEVDNSLIGFACWYRFGDWRELGAWGAPENPVTFAALLLSRTSEYQTRAGAVSRLLRGRGIQNICCGLNVCSHHEPGVSAPYNQTVLGAAYYASALLRLLRGGADAELFWTGTDATGCHGLIDHEANPSPAFHAKKLCARFLRQGDRIWFPDLTPAWRGVEAVVARGLGGRQSSLVVHLRDEEATYPVLELLGGREACRMLLQVDGGTGGRVVERHFDGSVRFEGYGVAVATPGESHA